MNAIETHALTRRFGAHTAVDGLDLTVRQGELFALLGVAGFAAVIVWYLVLSLVTFRRGQ